MEQKQMEWILNNETKELYYLENNREIKVLNITIIANGIGDLVFVRDKNNNKPKLVSRSKAAKKDIIADIKTDIAVIELDRDTDKFFMFEVNPSNKPMLDYILTIIKPEKIGKDFAMYGGDTYGEAAL